jgi:hypothetical protein
MKKIRHIKRGSVYDVIGVANLQVSGDTPLADYDEVVVYRSEEDGRLWVRRVSEISNDRSIVLE